MNQMWVEIGLNAFQINCSDDSRYANDQYHIFWQLVVISMFQRTSKLVIQQDYLNSNHVTSKHKDILHKKLHKKISVFNMASWRHSLFYILFLRCLHFSTEQTWDVFVWVPYLNILCMHAHQYWLWRVAGGCMKISGCCWALRCSFYNINKRGTCNQQFEAFAIPRIKP